MNQVMVAFHDERRNYGDDVVVENGCVVIWRFYDSVYVDVVALRMDQMVNETFYVLNDDDS